MRHKSTKQLALVTGGSRGIGRAIVLKLAEKGYNVAFSYNTQRDAANSLTGEALRYGGDVRAYQAELGNTDSLLSMLNAIDADFSQDIDVLVNNAGIAQEKPFLDISSADFHSMMCCNLESAMLLCQKVLPAMQEIRQGKIVNITSIGGQWGGVNQVHYAMAKAGLIALTRSIAKMYAKDNINCNAVSPGLIETAMISQELKSAAGQKKAKAIPCGRVGDTSEIADIVAFLAGPESSYLHGQTLNANGGMLFS